MTASKGTGFPPGVMEMFGDWIEVLVTQQGECTKTH